MASAMALDVYRPWRHGSGASRSSAGLGFITARDFSATQTIRRWPGWRTALDLKLHFADGDITARNVLRETSGRSVLIDWEWAGLYPAGYELAFLWSSFVNIPAARAKVEAVVPASCRSGFVLSAALVQLLHLQMWQQRPHPLADRHRERSPRLEEVGRAR